ncbi:uncharacterized protein [Euwallacea fornicatus]|uniref:uncharacterized protein n=1 Tax=Euwallacea fornicatus TaxID=995702 RepID=UPI00338FB5B3
MSDLEEIQKKLVSFCEILPQHVETWKDALAAMQDPLRALCNFCEQLRAVEEAHIMYIENFEIIQRDLQVKILGHIEEELEALKPCLGRFNKCNHDLKNKLASLERATIDLDWDLKSPLLQGSPIQPPLAKLLQMAYEFWIFFSEASKDINNKLKTINVRDEKSMDECQKALNVNLVDNNKVYPLLAITQYVINEKAVV